MSKNAKIELHIDVETFSSENIRDVGAYKYTESPDFEIMLLAYATGDEKPKVVDFMKDEKFPEDFLDMLTDPNVIKKAHNANFERLCFAAMGIDVPIEQWECTQVKAGFCGLPLGLEQLSDALKLGEKGKLKEGKALIRYFCMPAKPTKKNQGRHRNLPHHDPEKWESFKKYVAGDVISEREVDKHLGRYNIPQFERDLYILDQRINDRGIAIDEALADNAIHIYSNHVAETIAKLKEITELGNPNSLPQIKGWLGEKLQREVKTLNKETTPDIISESESLGLDEVSNVLKLRSELSKTSISKYPTMKACLMYDGRIRGLLKFYGANRTGRWAGRLVQVQNLPRNYNKDLDGDRNIIKFEDYETAKSKFDNIPSVLSQLIRTALVAPENKTFAVADFSAIEARVTAWLASENWRLKVFNSHGKIYEASASTMFNVPLEDIDKGSDLRQRGKVAELALGYGGGVGALVQMGAEDMGLNESEMKDIVKRWREASPYITKMWRAFENAAIQAVKVPKNICICRKFKGVAFYYDGLTLRVVLPSGRRLYYYKPKLVIGKFGNPALQYMGIHQKTRQWTYLDTYGGKLTENIVQAIARDLLAVTLLRLEKQGFYTVMHVHDEAICEVSKDTAEQDLGKMCDIMAQPVGWAESLPLGADGYLTEYYKKD